MKPALYNYLDVDLLREQLASAEKRLIDTERLVGKQRAVLAHLRAQGHDPTPAETWLQELEHVRKRRTQSRDRIQSRLRRQLKAS